MKIKQFISFETADKHLHTRLRVRCNYKRLSSKDKTFLYSNKSNTKNYYVFRTWCNQFEKYIWNIQRI